MWCAVITVACFAVGFVLGVTSWAFVVVNKGRLETLQPKDHIAAGQPRGTPYH